MVTSVSKGVRVAAGIVCAVFAAFVLIHLLWAVGVTWGLEEVSGGKGELDATWGQRAVTLPLAIAALVVARTHARPHAGDAQRPPLTRAPVAR